jgi:DNA-binding transcriptional LysR family regulator
VVYLHIPIGYFKQSTFQFKGGMRIDQIKNFVKTVDSLSITKAAEELYISQSVLSRQISSMEQQLGIVLFERSKSGIKLTSVGAVAYEHFAKVLHAYENALYYINEYQEHMIGTLKFGKLIGLRMPKSIQDALAEFSKIYHKTAILRNSLNNSAMAKKLRNGDFDIYLTWKQEVEDGRLFEFVEVCDAETSLAVSSSHPLATCGHATIEMFKDDNWITVLQEESYKQNMAMAQLFKDIGFEPHLIYANDLSGMVDLINDGVGVGIISKSHILHGASSMTFIDLPQLPNRTMALACRKDNENPLTQEYMRILNKYLATEA